MYNLDSTHSFIKHIFDFTFSFSITLMDLGYNKYENEIAIAAGLHDSVLGGCVQVSFFGD